jgi:hypothetical protein
MSRNSKTAKRAVAAKQASEQRVAARAAVKAGTRPAGPVGAVKTAPKHGKKKAWWMKFPSYGAYIRGSKKQGAEA